MKLLNFFRRKEPIEFLVGRYREYTCAVCKSTVYKNYDRCPNCGVGLKWRD